MLKRGKKGDPEAPKRGSRGPKNATVIIGIAARCLISEPRAPPKDQRSLDRRETEAKELGD